MKKGFSMIELLVVIGIIGIIMAIAIPSFGRMQQRARIRAAANEVAQDLRQIRERALSVNGGYQVSFPDNRHYLVTKPDGNTTTYQIGGATGGNIYISGVGAAGNPPEGSGSAPGSGIDFPGNVLMLDARGGATKGVLYITDGRENYAVGISTLGKVRVYKYGSGGWN